MGQQVVGAVCEAPDLVLTALVDPAVASVSLPDGAIGCESVDALPDGSADVLVDFSVPSAARAHLLPALRRGFHLVVGTTGLPADLVAELEAAAGEGAANILIAANFALGAVLAMRFAEMAAPHFTSVEVIELHHDQKVDAPSGTSLATAERIAAARAAGGLGEVHDPTEDILIEGARGAGASGGVRIHSVRLPGLVAHEEILFGGPGEGLSIRHDSYDRVSFMGGVLLAVREVGGRPGLTRGLDPLIGG